MVASCLVPLLLVLSSRAFLSSLLAGRCPAVVPTLLVVSAALRGSTPSSAPACVLSSHIYSCCVLGLFCTIPVTHRLRAPGGHRNVVTFRGDLWLASYIMFTDLSPLRGQECNGYPVSHFCCNCLAPSHAYASSNLAYKVGRGHPTGSWGLPEVCRIIVFLLV